MTAPSTPIEHRKVSDAIDDRLTRVWEVYRRVKGEAFNLSVLAFIHFVLSNVPEAKYLALEVSDQGGDDMRFRGAGVLAAGIDTDELAVVEIDGVDYAEVDESSHDLAGCEDALLAYASSIEDYQLGGQPWYERTGTRHSGQGRLWIAPALEALNDTYEGFMSEALDPFPDPNDAVAVAAWLARETAPTEETS